MGFTIWFTGLSGSGKTTLSQAVYLEIRRRGLKSELLDGDIIRSIFSQELGFTKRDRDINIRRIGFVSHLLNKNEVCSVVAAISPYSDTRLQVRNLIGGFVEVYCDSSLDTVIQRDVKGLYKKALAGQIQHFTGVSDPYETPVTPEIHLHTDKETVEESYCRIIAWLEEHAYLPTLDACTPHPFTADDEAKWRERLAQLGFAAR
jgi:adenylylsulfate kinase